MKNTINPSIGVAIENSINDENTLNSLANDLIDTATDDLIALAGASSETVKGVMIPLSNDEVIKSIALKAIDVHLEAYKAGLVDLIIDLYHQSLFKVEYIPLKSASLVFGIKSLTLQKWIDSKLINSYEVRTHILVSCREIRMVIDHITSTIRSSNRDDYIKKMVESIKRKAIKSSIKVDNVF